MNPDPAVTESNISRWVTFLFGPLAVIAGGFIAIKSKQWFGYDLEPAEATAYVLGVVGSIATGVALWIRNRGKYEIAERTGIDEETLTRVAKIVAEQLPAPPQAARPGGGSPASPRAPGG
jgi:hypothetical protein